MTTVYQDCINQSALLLQVHVSGLNSCVIKTRNDFQTCPKVLLLHLQVLTSVLSYYTRGKPPLTFSCPGKTPADYWGKSSGETELLFFKGELLHGCMDKAQYGKFGLVHAVQVRPSTLRPILYQETCCKYCCTVICTVTMLREVLQRQVLK